MNIRGRNKINPNFNMSSMTDIVFLLLIFFMITSTLVTVNAIDVILPKASGKTENKKAISVSIDSNQNYFIDQEAVNQENLELTLLERLEEGQVLIIRGDEKSSYDKVMFVIDIANRNKLKMILAVKGG
ncbi:MAG: ExbD/TolR family protein [Flavobacteriaceae bacterium]